MKGCGKKIYDMEKLSRGILTATVTTDTLKLERQTGKVFTPGQTAKSTTVNGCRGLSKATVSGEAFTMTLT